MEKQGNSKWTKISNIIITICISFIVLFFILHSIEETYKHLPRAIIRELYLCSLIGIIILASLDERHRPSTLLKDRSLLKPTNWMNFYGVAYGICAITLLIAVVDHWVGDWYRFTSLMMAFLFPALYVVWNIRGDHKTFFDRFAAVSCIAMAIFYILCILFAQYHEGTTVLSGEYVGLTSNSNRLGVLGVWGTACSFYLIVSQPRYRGLFILSTAMSGALTIESGSRAAILAFGCQCVVFAVMEVKFDEQRGMDRKRALKTIAATGVLIICLVPLTNILIHIGDGSNLIHIGDGSTLQIGSDSGAGSGESSGGGSGSGSGENSGGGSGDEGAELDNAASSSGVPDNSKIPEYYFVERTTKFEKLDQLMSWRISLWKWYWEKLDFRGHDMRDHILVLPTGHRVHHAHNQPLEYGYRAGIVCGLAYLAMEIYYLIYIIKKFKQKTPVEVGSLLTMLISITFFCLSMLDVQTTPFSRVTCMAMFLTMAPLFQKGDASPKNPVSQG